MRQPKPEKTDYSENSRALGLLTRQSGFRPMVFRAERYCTVTARLAEGVYSPTIDVRRLVAAILQPMAAAGVAVVYKLGITSRSCTHHLASPSAWLSSPEITKINHHSFIFFFLFFSIFQFKKELFHCCIKIAILE